MPYYHMFYTKKLNKQVSTISWKLCPFFQPLVFFRLLISLIYGHLWTKLHAGFYIKKMLVPNFYIGTTVNNNLHAYIIEMIFFLTDALCYILFHAAVFKNSLLSHRCVTKSKPRSLVYTFGFGWKKRQSLSLTLRIVFLKSAAVMDSS